MNPATCSQTDDIRMIRYRIGRLGMLELETWLAELLPALHAGNSELIAATCLLLERDTPELVAMMQGELALPEIFFPWLKSS